MNGFQRIGEDCGCPKKIFNFNTREKIERLKKTVAREKAARQQAEKTIERSSRQLYLANQEAAALDKELESTLQNLNETLRALTSARQKRLAIIVTLVLATILFFVTRICT